MNGPLLPKSKHQGFFFSAAQGGFRAGKEAEKPWKRSLFPRNVWNLSSHCTPQPVPIHTQIHVGGGGFLTPQSHPNVFISSVDAVRLRWGDVTSLSVRQSVLCFLILRVCGCTCSVDFTIYFYVCVFQQGSKGDPGLPGLPGPAGYRGQKGDRVRRQSPTLGLLFNHVFIISQSPAWACIIFYKINKIHPHI